MDYVGQHLLLQSVQVVQVVLQVLLNTVVHLETGDAGVEQQLHLILVLDRQQQGVAQVLDLIVEIDAVHVRKFIAV